MAVGYRDPFFGRVVPNQLTLGTPVEKPQILFSRLFNRERVETKDAERGPQQKRVESSERVEIAKAVGRFFAPPLAATAAMIAVWWLPASIIGRVYGITPSLLLEGLPYPLQVLNFAAGLATFVFVEVYAAGTRIGFFYKSAQDKSQ